MVAVIAISSASGVTTEAIRRLYICEFFAARNPPTRRPAPHEREHGRPGSREERAQQSHPDHPQQHAQVGDRQRRGLGVQLRQQHRDHAAPAVAMRPATVRPRAMVRRSTVASDRASAGRMRVIRRAEIRDATSGGQQRDERAADNRERAVGQPDGVRHRAVRDELAMDQGRQGQAGQRAGHAGEQAQHEGLAVDQPTDLAWCRADRPKQRQLAIALLDRTA